MEPQFLQIGSQNIAFYQSKGDGPAALLLHGNSSSGKSFQHQLESTLGEQFRLVAIDLPGHGRSDYAKYPQLSYTLPQYASIVVQVANALSLSNAFFVGWSLGGHILLEASSELPKAAGFMIFGTPPVGDPSTMADAFLPNPAMKLSFKPELTEEEMKLFYKT